MENKNHDLRVWYIDRVPSNKNLYVPVKTIQEAMLVIKTLTERDLLDERITDNAMGLQEFMDDEWLEYEDGEGKDIDELIDERNQF